MSDLKLVSVKDATIADISPELSYAVKSGASSTTYSSFSASSASSSSVSFNVPVPSESVVVDRAIKLKSTFGLQFKITQVAAGDRAFDPGLLFSLQAFPISSCMQSLTCQINNSTVSSQVKDVLPIIMRMTNREILESYNGGTPSMPDAPYQSFNSMVNTNSSILSSINNASFDAWGIPRGAHPIDRLTVSRLEQDGTVTASNISTDPTDIFTVSVEWTTTEPLMLSPFIWSDPSQSAQGLVGVGNLIFTLNMDSTYSRLISMAKYQLTTPANPYYMYDVKYGFDGSGKIWTNNPSLECRFLSLQPTDRVESSNACPYTEYPLLSKIDNVTLTSNGAPVKLQSNSISLAMIPDLFLICARKPSNKMGWTDTNSFYKITDVSLQFNNANGLLSGATPYALWQMSRRNGSNQSFAEFNGVAFDNNPIGDQAATIGANVATTGSLLVVSPSYDMSLPSFLSSGSMGQFSFQASVTVQNTTPVDATEVELVIICVNSGIMITQAGMTSTSLGMLNRDMVLSAAQMESVSSSSIHSMIGGRLFSSHGAALAKLIRHHVRKLATGGSMASAAASGARMSGGSSSLTGLY
jgi:hypothetical protein